MTNQPREFTLGGYVESIRRQWWLLLIIVVIGAGVGYAYSKLNKPSYSATSSLTVSDPNQSLALFGGTVVSGKTPLQQASAASSQVTRPEVISGVRDKIGKKIGASDVSVSVDPNSYVININATSDSPSRAAAIANAFADVDTSLTNSEARTQFAQQAKAIDQQAKQKNLPAILAAANVETAARAKTLSKVATPMVVSTRATAPASSGSHTARDTVIGLIVGLLLGMGVATARDVFDRRLRHTRDVSGVLEDPTIGYIPEAALGHAGTPAGASNGAKPVSAAHQEAFRILRENVAYFGGAPKSVVLVTSAASEEGKSTVAAGLAVATAEAGKRTLLVECDLRKPALAHRFGIKDGPGLTDYLTSNAQPHEIVQPVPGIMQPLNGSGPAHSNGQAAASNLVCISSGSPVSRPAELLASDRFQTFLTEVSDVYETVILDTAPLLSVADTLAIVPSASMLLVCVRLQRTTRDLARAARSALERLPERPVGIVVTGVTQQGDGYYDFYGAPTPPRARAASV
jgi:Mrp family chromosome partitioning ATPase